MLALALLFFGLGFVVSYVALPNGERHDEEKVTFPKPKSLDEFVERLKTYGDVIVASDEGLPIVTTVKENSYELSAVAPMFFETLDEFGLPCDEVVVHSHRFVHIVKVVKYYVLILSEEQLSPNVLKGIRHYARVNLPELLGE